AFEKSHSSRVTTVQNAKEGIERRYDQFLDRAVSAGKVWGLKSRTKNHWCLARSLGSGARDVMPFWPDRDAAQACVKNDWAALVPGAIPLDRFLDKWLPGMSRDTILVGVHWNEKLVGLEIEPLDLRKDLGARMGAVKTETG
ncbi:MAG: DUF2750 domain-containing protein, partial [Phycisphaerae bacterium]